MGKNCGFFTWAIRFQNRLSYKITTLPITTLQFRLLMKVLILFVIYNQASKTCELPIFYNVGFKKNDSNFENKKD